jgi:ribonuclease HII
MRRADLDHPGYGFAIHKGYPTPGHVAAATERGCLSPLHRRSVHPKAYAGPGPVPA